MQLNGANFIKPFHPPIRIAMKKISIPLLALLLVQAHAQENRTKNEKLDHTYKPMVLKLDEKGNKFIRFITGNQF